MPSKIYAVNAVGDSAPPTAAYLAAAWGGASATLDGNARRRHDGVAPPRPAPARTCSRSAARRFSASVGFGAAPAATFAANPTNINPGQTSALSWTTTAGAFLDRRHRPGRRRDQRRQRLALNVSPTAATTYSLLDVTDTGGWPGSATVMVSGAAPTINSFTTNTALVNPGSTGEARAGPRPARPRRTSTAAASR